MAELTPDQIRISHLVHDNEVMRGAIIRGMGTPILLLEDALAALENGRLEIVREFVERSLEACKKEQSRARDRS